MPVFFVNGTNDAAYRLDSYSKTYNLVKTRRNFRITVNMPHSHEDGWAPREIGLFIDQYLKGAVPLTTIMKPQLSKGQVRAKIKCQTNPISANLYYTTGTTPINQLGWQTLPARIDGASIAAPLPPDEATIWFMTLKDSREAIVSSELVFATQGE